MWSGPRASARSRTQGLGRLGLIGTFILLLATTAFGAQNAPVGDHPFEAVADAEDCTEAVPEQASIAGVIDDGRTVVLDVHLLLDGVSQSRAAEIMRQVQKAYAPLRINLRTTYQEVAFPPQRYEIEFALDTEKHPTSDYRHLVEESKRAVGGTRPADADVVYLLTADRITGGTAGFADCIGGIRYPTRAFGVGEEEPDRPSSGISFCCTWTTAKIAAHEIAHLLGAHHHYANCAEGTPTAVEDGQAFTCTMMFNDVGAVNLHFSALEGAVVRGHALEYGDRSADPGPTPAPKPSSEPQPEPSAIPSSSPERTTYSRTVDLTLARHLVARGLIDDGGAEGCSAGMTVRVERIKGGVWTLVATASSGADGSYRVKLADRGGRYRAVVGASAHDGYECSAATSRLVTHRH